MDDREIGVDPPRPNGGGAAPVLLYDGECGLCAASVRFVLRRDRIRELRFAALGGPFGIGVVARHPELVDVDSMVWVEPATKDRPETVEVLSDAALRVAGYLGGGWRVAAALRAVPRAVRDAAYRWIARHRHRLLGGEPSCLVPDPADRERFLDG